MLIVMENTTGSIVIMSGFEQEAIATLINGVATATGQTAELST
jgi:hypothetical protein